jgi:hypothetical protein
MPEPQILPPIQGTAMFSEDSCVLGINGLPAKTRIFLRSDRLYSDDGREIIWPNDNARIRGMSILKKCPQKFTVAEFGPHGPIAEYAVDTDDSDQHIAGTPSPSM